MFGFNRSRRNRDSAIRHLTLESLEDRRMLSTMGDVVFLVDNSESDVHVTKDWLKAAVTGDMNGNGLKDPGELNLSERLAAQGVDDVRYGLVAFGEIYEVDGSKRFAHSEVVDTDTTKSVFDRLFSAGVTAQDHIDDLESTIDHLIEVERGGDEDGWDAMDHAMAEYDFRPGAVPIFALVQNEEGRIRENQNGMLTHDGILAALNSKNVILDTLTVGASGSAGLFDLSPFGLSSDIRVLGVDADAADGMHDGVHNYHWTDTNTFN